MVYSRFSQVPQYYGTGTKLVLWYYSTSNRKYIDSIAELWGSTRKQSDTQTCNTKYGLRHDVDLFGFVGLKKVIAAEDATPDSKRIGCSIARSQLSQPLLLAQSKSTLSRYPEIQGDDNQPKNYRCL